MKIIRWIGHPVILICIYLLFITEGENFGGFYMIYLMLALPHGAAYAVLAALGIACVVVGFNLPGKKRYWLKPTLYLSGLAFMISSLVNFFSTGDQSGTFEWGFPFITFIILCTCATFFLVYSLSLFYKPFSRNIQTVL